MQVLLGKESRACISKIIEENGIENIDLSEPIDSDFLVKLLEQVGQSHRVNELVRDSQLKFDFTKPKKRAKNLFQKLEELHARNEYARLTQSIQPKERVKLFDSDDTFLSSEDKKELVDLLNVVLTVLSSSAFAFLSGYLMKWTIPNCILIAFVVGMIVFIADFYFIVTRMK